jgi:hypothetical protein
MKKILLFSSVIIITCYRCKQTATKVTGQAPATSRDTSINWNLYSEIFFDSLQMEKAYFKQAVS